VNGDAEVIELKIALEESRHQNRLWQELFAKIGLDKGLLAPGHRYCRQCKTIKPLSNFYFYPASGWTTTCKLCRNESCRKWKAKHKDQVKQRSRNYYLKNQNRYILYARWYRWTHSAGKFDTSISLDGSTTEGLSWHELHADQSQPTEKEIVERIDIESFLKRLFKEDCIFLGTYIDNDFDLCATASLLKLTEPDAKARLEYIQEKAKQWDQER